METALASPMNDRTSFAAAAGLLSEAAGNHPPMHEQACEESSQDGTGREVVDSTETARPKRKRLTVYLPVPLLDRLRNTVYWTRGTTIAGLLEMALNQVLSEKERQCGGPLPRRLQELKGGRPPRQARNR